MPKKTKPLPKFTIEWVDHEKNPEAKKDGLRILAGWIARRILKDQAARKGPARPE